MEFIVYANVYIRIDAPVNVNWQVFRDNYRSTVNIDWNITYQTVNDCIFLLCHVESGIILLGLIKAKPSRFIDGKL